ncbi:hypothetical protein IIA15_08850 [candidate division TA06 bacterium]|nr:hypothetical protein [candidate division TA06 bacterium]
MPPGYGSGWSSISWSSWAVTASWWSRLHWVRIPISDLDTLQRDSQARRIGADLYREAAAISPKNR